jgi:cytoskeletal protein CcmA (bactofilin family)
MVSFASIFKSADDIHISNLHIIEDDFYGVGERIRIDGTIDGDLLAMGNSCTIQGTVMKSANIGARNVHHSGHIVGTLRAFGETVTINGKVDGSVVSAGRVLKINQGAVIDRDVNLYGEEVSLDGIVIGRAKICAGRVYITGTIQGDVDIEADRFSISPPAVINGNLIYTSEREANIDADGVTILGEVTWKLPEEPEDSEGGSTYLAEIAMQTSNLLAAFLFGIIIIRLFRPYAEESFDQLRNRMTVSLAAGFLGVLVIAGCVVVLFASLIAALVGAILISSDQALVGSLVVIVPTLLIPITSFVTVSGGIILYSGQIMVACLVGYGLVRFGRREAATMNAWSLLLGLIVITIFFAIPYLGFLLFLTATLTGSGAILLGIKTCRRGEKISNNSSTSSSGSLPPPETPPGQ